MKKNGNSMFLIGIIILIAGLAAAGYGYYLYDGMNNSVAGVLGKIGRKISGKSELGTRAMLFMIGGGAVALFGAFVAFVRGKR